MNTLPAAPRAMKSNGPETAPAHGGHLAMMHRSCGNETTQGEVCGVCGDPLVADQMTWLKPWKDARDHLVGADMLTAP